MLTIEKTNCIFGHCPWPDGSTGLILFARELFEQTAARHRSCIPAGPDAGVRNTGVADLSVGDGCRDVLLRALQSIFGSCGSNPHSRPSKADRDHEEGHRRTGQETRSSASPWVPRTPSQPLPRALAGAGTHGRTPAVADAG